MKSNNLSVQERLRYKISFFQKTADCMIPGERRNPYHKCRFCDRHSPDISNSGHARGYPVTGAEKSLEYFQGLLAAAGEPVRKPRFASFRQWKSWENWR